LETIGSGTYLKHKAGVHTHNSIVTLELSVFKVAVCKNSYHILIYHLLQINT